MTSCWDGVAFTDLGLSAGASYQLAGGASGVLYALPNTPTDGNNVETVTFATRTLANSSYAPLQSTGAFGRRSPAVDPTTGTIYYVRNNGFADTIRSTSNGGSDALLSAPGTVNDIAQIAFDSSGTLYAWGSKGASNGYLATVDKSTGAFTLTINDSVFDTYTEATSGFGLVTSDDAIWLGVAGGKIARVAPGGGSYAVSSTFSPSINHLITFDPNATTSVLVRGSNGTGGQRVVSINSSFTATVTGCDGPDPTNAGPTYQPMWDYTYTYYWWQGGVSPGNNAAPALAKDQWHVGAIHW